MRGLVLEGPQQIVHRDDLAAPVVRAPTDAVVRVSRSGLCGSDLHPYLGREEVRFGVVAGHEAVGVVVDVGASVTDVAVGQRVAVPFTTSCGHCGPCRRGLTSRCVDGQLFGFGSPTDDAMPSLPGAQAEYVRVPLADTTLVPVPADLSDTAAVLLTDNLPTAWHAVHRAEAGPGATIAVVGLGTVGLCAVAVARRLGAHVVGIDPVGARRVLATDLGARAGSPDAARELMGTAEPDGGAAAVVEAAGTVDAQRLAASLLRPGGTLSVIAVQTARRFGVTPVEAYDANLTMRFGRAPVRAVLARWMDEMRDLAHGLAPVVITDPDTPLEDGPDTYRRVADRVGGVAKVVFAP